VCRRIPLSVNFQKCWVLSILGVWKCLRPATFFAHLYLFVLMDYVYAKILVVHHMLRVRYRLYDCPVAICDLTIVARSRW